jgi:adenylate kinase family enzyme
MRKILVIGSGGAGKSVLAARLGELLQIEVLHLDKFYWHPGWMETPKAEWLKTVEELLKRDAWIMDGNYSGTLDMRLEACDTVIFLDPGRMLCLWRVLKRIVMYRNGRRPDMAEGCREKFSLKFVLWVWEYSRRTRPKVIKKLKLKAETKKIVWLRTASEVEEFLTHTRGLRTAGGEQFVGATSSTVASSCREKAGTT